jgi:MYXO-CTERM domain-containing protein
MDCTEDMHCSAGFTCSDSSCIPTPEGRCSTDRTEAQDPAGNFVKDCSPYFCTNGQCESTCDGAADCQVGYTCDRRRNACRRSTPPPASEELTACGCRVPGRTAASSRSAAWLLLGVALTAAWRRRPRAA